MCAITRSGVWVLYDLSWCSCLYVNFDLGMRRGDVMESGDEAKNGAGDDILTRSGHLRGSRYARGTCCSVAITINRQSLRSLPGPSGARRVFAWSCVIHEPTALTALGPPPSEPPARQKYWQIRTNFTTLLLYNHNLNPDCKDYSKNLLASLTCLGSL